MNLSNTILKNGIPSRCYYELLEWKDKSHQNFVTVRGLFGTPEINKLTPEQLNVLYFVVFKKRINEAEPITFEIESAGFNRKVIIKDVNEKVVFTTNKHHPEADIHFSYAGEHYLILSNQKRVFKQIQE